MNGIHLMVIGVAAAAFLGLHPEAGSLFLFVASAAQTSSPGFAGYADLPGVRLWYTDSGGNGAALILLHANTGNADSWQYNIPGFVESGYRVITFDRRGWGRSRPNPGTGPQPGTIADDLHALVEHLGIDRFHLVGVAGGGFAAYDYVLWHPERLRSLVVAASGGAIVDEELVNECQEPRQMLWIADITSETRPINVSTWTVPEASGNFCSRGGRFGTHSSNENMTPIYYNRVLFLAHFNAGVRAVDIRDPFNPKEIGFYVPAITSKTDKRCVEVSGTQRCKTAIQTNNVDVDDRGYVYLADRADTGLHIVELAGSARALGSFPKP